MKHLKLKFIGLAAMLAGLAMQAVAAADIPLGQPQTAYTVTASDLKALATRLEADPALTEGQCVPLTAEGSKATSASYSCAKPSAKTDATFRSVVGAGASLATTTAGCPANCVVTYCPFPVIQCCNIYTHIPCQ